MVHYLAFPRSYSVDGLKVGGGELPEDILALFNFKYLFDLPPGLPRMVGWLSAEPIAVHTQTGPLSVRRWGLHLADINVVDVVLEFEGAPLQTAGLSLLSNYENLFADTSTHLLRRADGAPTCLYELWDEAFRDLTSTEVPNQIKVRFGPVTALTGPDVASRKALAVEGLESDQTVTVDHNRICVSAPGALDRAAMMPYLSMALFSNRARLLYARLSSEIRAVSFLGEVGVKRGAAALSIFARSVEVSRRALIARRHFVPLNTLNGSVQLRLQEEVNETLVMNGPTWSVLESSLDGLDRFTNGLYLLTSARSQQMLNWNGFAIAILGLIFTAVGISAFATERSGRPAIITAWLASGLLLVLINYAARRALAIVQIRNTVRSK